MATMPINHVTERLNLRNRIVGLLLRDARQRAERSLEECAAALGVTVETLMRYEEGELPISLPEIEVLAYLTNTPLSHFMAYDPDLLPEEKPIPLTHVLSLRHRIVGALLQKARMENGIPQKELAAVLQCPVERIAAYEFGEQPIPLAELELLAQHLRLPIEHFLDNQQGSLGEWQRRRESWRRFSQLPQEVQDFVIQPINIKYLEVALKLSQMPVDGLRGIAEGLLDITY